MTTFFGFVHAGDSPCSRKECGCAGTLMGWSVIAFKKTEKAVCVRDTLTQRVCWIPLSQIAQPNADGERYLSNWAVSLIRNSGFRASHVYGDVL